MIQKKKKNNKKYILIYKIKYNKIYKKKNQKNKKI